MRINAAQERAGLERKLTAIHDHMDSAYNDKLEGNIPLEFWKRKQTEWQTEELPIKSLIPGLEAGKSEDNLLSIQRILELAQKAYFLYLTRKPAEQAELLKKVLLNCSIESTNLYPSYRKPFDLIAKRVKTEELLGREGFEPPTPWYRTVNA